MRARTALLVDGLLAQLPAEDPEKAQFQARAHAYSTECGCAMGGFFLMGALALSAVYGVLTGDVGLTTALAGIAFAVGATLLGKLAGILLAALRLALLHRKLATNLRRSTHVLVH